MTAKELIAWATAFKRCRGCGKMLHKSAKNTCRTCVKKRERN